MIVIFSAQEQIFYDSWLVALDECIKCVINEKLNGEYALNLVYPLNSKKAVYIQTFNIVKANDQLFRIYNVERDSKANTMTAYARHIFYDLRYYVVDGLKIEGLTCQQAMELLMQNIQPNSFYDVNSDLSGNCSLDINLKNGVEAMFELVDAYNGKLIRDNHDITITGNTSLNKGVQIKYGKNIIGINEKIDSDNVITKIYPVGKNGLMLPERYLVNKLAKSTYQPEFELAKKVELPDADTEFRLRNQAEGLLLYNAKPRANYKIDFIKLTSTPEYKEYKALEQMAVGDKVKVIHEIMGLNLNVNIIGIERDILSDRNTKVELGQPFNFDVSSLFNLSSLRRLLVGFIK